MPAADSKDVPVLQQVFHPSDFTPASETAFAHALKAALVAKADLTILHVSTKETSDWTEFPGVRATLERWGLLPKNSSQADVSKLGVGVKKIQARHDDPVESVTAYLNNHNTDLIVLATDQSKESSQWLSKSLAAPIARKSRLMTLFIPKGLDGFVSLDDGSISLNHILIPVASVPPAQPAIQGAARMARRLNIPSGVFTLLHVGEKESMPTVQLPELPGWKSNVVAKQGEVIDVIIETAREVKAGLIVMTTDGRNGFLDALRGSHSERILRRTPCPLLAIPAGSFMASVI
ncbi:MAG: universal stress protein [Nitrospira sp. CR1.3]|nr:universal stress protein [Nitrospira sp. CR1.3]